MCVVSLPYKPDKTFFKVIAGYLGYWRLVVASLKVMYASAEELSRRISLNYTQYSRSKTLTPRRVIEAWRLFEVVPA